MKPILTKNERKTVLARIGGSRNREASTRIMPGSSRMYQYCPSGKVTPRGSQNMSERLTLFSGKARGGSQSWKEAKKFQFGPRRKVPSTISVTHSTTKPRRNVATANFRCANVK